MHEAVRVKLGKSDVIVNKKITCGQHLTPRPPSPKKWCIGSWGGDHTKTKFVVIWCLWLPCPSFVQETEESKVHAHKPLATYCVEYEAAAGMST